MTLSLLAPFCANGLHGVCQSPARNDWNATETYERERELHSVGGEQKRKYSMTKGSRKEKYEILGRERIEVEEIVKR